MSKRKITVVIAACLTLLLSITAFAYGEQVYRIIEELTIGEHASFFVVEVTADSIDLPAELKGKLFDENGNELTAYPKDDSPVYTEFGEKVDHVEWTDDGRGSVIVTEAEAQNIIDKTKTSTTSKEKARQNTMFDFKTPAYIPEGYTETYKIYNDKSGQPSPDCKYLDVEYKNEKGHIIYVMLRYMDETTAFSTGAGDNAKKVDINGYEAIISDQSLEIEIDGILYSLINHTIERDELVKMASSLE